MGIICSRDHFPQLSTEAKSKIKAFLLKLRSESSDDVIQKTARQYRSIIRLAEASAKVRLSSEVTAEDGDRAIRITAQSIAQLCFKSDGKLHIDQMMYKRSKKQMLRPALISLFEKMNELKHDIIVGKLEALGYYEKSTDYMISRLLDQGLIYEYHSHIYRYIGSI